MRIKIDGELTLDRLQHALFEAEAHVGENFRAFYNVNIYLTPYSVAGKAMSTKDSTGNDLILHIPAIDGIGPELSALSPEDRQTLLRMRREDIESEARAAKERRKVAEEAARTQRVEEDKAWRAQTEAQERRDERYRAERDLIEQGSKAAFGESVQHFNDLIGKVGSELIVSELNSIIEQVWCELVPKYHTGAKKGEVRSQPYFVVWPAGGIAIMRGGGSKVVSKQDSPFGLIDSRGRASRMWQYSEWACVVERMQCRLNEIGAANQLPPLTLAIKTANIIDPFENGRFEALNVWSIIDDKPAN